MTNQQILELIAEYSRVELNQVSLYEMGEELKDINLTEFKNFIKRSLDRIELQYTPKGLERFMKFVSMYKKEINSEREKKAQAESKRLEEKFRFVKLYLNEEIEKGLNPKLNFIKKNGNDYFASFEISTLNKIGDVRYLIRLDNEFRLQEEIEKTFINLIGCSQNKISHAPNLKLNIKRF